MLEDIRYDLVYKRYEKGKVGPRIICDETQMSNKMFKTKLPVTITQAGGKVERWHLMKYPRICVLTNMQTKVVCIIRTTHKMSSKSVSNATNLSAKMIP